MILTQIKFLKDLDSHMRDLVMGSAVAMVFRFAAGASQLIFNVLLARMLGAKEMGVFALALSISAISSVIGQLGMNQSLLRFIAAHSEENDWEKVKGVFVRGMSIALGTSVLVSGFVYSLADWFSLTVFGNPELTGPIQWMAMSIVPFSLLSLTAEALRAVKRITDYSLIRLLLVPVICIVLLLGFSLNELILVEALISYLFSTVMVMFIGFWLWWRAKPEIWEGNKTGNFSTRRLMQVSIPMAWIATLNIVSANADTVILGINREATEVGVYSAAVGTVMVMGFIHDSINTISAPKFSALYHLRDLSTIERIAGQSTKIMLFCVTPLALFFVFFPGLVMGIYGEQFKIGAPALIIISVGYWVSTASGSPGFILMMTDHENVAKRLNILSAASNVLISILLIPKLGLMGAALARAASIIVFKVLGVLAVRKHLKISSTVLMTMR